MKTNQKKMEKMVKSWMANKTPKKKKIVTTETLEKIEGTEIPEKYENKSREDGKNGEKSDGKQDTKKEKIVTAETLKKN